MLTFCRVVAGGAAASKAGLVRVVELRAAAAGRGGVVFLPECPGQQHHLNQIKPTHPHAEEVAGSREQRSGLERKRKVWDKSDKSVCSIEHNLALRSELHRDLQPRSVISSPIHQPRLGIQ